VEKVDAAGLQALLAGRRLLEAAGKSVAWTGCSPQLVAVAGLLGLAGPLGIPS
jgi:anti-anti-sigma regulatory factor